LGAEWGGRDGVVARFWRCKASDAFADGEVVWSWRPDAGVKLAEFFRERRWQKSPVTGESTKESVKTIARGKLE